MAWYQILYLGIVWYRMSNSDLVEGLTTKLFQIARPKIYRFSMKLTIFASLGKFLFPKSLQTQDNIFKLANSTECRKLSIIYPKMVQ